MLLLVRSGQVSTLFCLTLTSTRRSDGGWVSSRSGQGQPKVDLGSGNNILIFNSYVLKMSNMWFATNASKEMNYGVDSGVTAKSASSIDVRSNGRFTS